MRLRFINKDNENDEIEVAPGYAGKYVDENGVEHLGLNELRISLDKDLINIKDVETSVLLDSNGEALESQEGVTTAFAGFEEDLRIINGATQSAGAIARGSIAWVLTDNDEDDDEAEPEDFFTDKTIATLPSAPVLELDGVRVKVAGVQARILRIAPDEIPFVVPESLKYTMKPRCAAPSIHASTCSGAKKLIVSLKPCTFTAFTLIAASPEFSSSIT